MTELGKQVVALLLPALPAETERCPNHGDRFGEAVCPACQKLFCRGCLQWDETAGALFCHPCRQDRTRRKRAGYLVAGLRHPLFFVLLLVGFGGFYFLAHRDRHAEPARAIAETEKPWFRRRVGIARVAQAQRARLRADALAQRGRDADARKWHGLTATALAQAGELLADSPFAVDFAIGYATAVGKAGDIATGVRRLREIEPRIADEPGLLPPFLFAQAELHWLAGERAAAFRDWARLLDLTTAGGGHGEGLLDDTLRMMTGGLYEATVGKHIRLACDTLPGDALWRAKTLHKLAEYGLDRRDLARPAGAGGNGAATDHAPSGRLERF